MFNLINSTKNEKKMSFLEHLAELRKRCLFSFFVLLITTSGCWFIRNFILAFIKKPLPQKYNLYYFSPVEGIFTIIKICFFTGVFIASPIILYQIWAFISPALKIKEKKTVLPFAFFSLIFFLSGITLCYFIILPFTLKFLIAFTPKDIQPYLSLGQYTSFIFYISLAFGLIFQLPIIMFFLTKFNILPPQVFRKRQKELIVIALVFAAIITPTVDPINQLLVAIPLILLYELGLIISFISYHKKNKNEVN